MSKLKNYFKVRLRRFLGIDDVEYKIDKLSRGVEYSQKSNVSYHDTLRDRINNHSDKIDAIHTTLESVVNIGTDVYQRSYSGGSWAVVCIEGRVNIVKFVNLNHRDVRDVMDFLKQFEAGRHCIDTPNRYFMDNLIFNIANKGR